MKGGGATGVRREAAREEMEEVSCAGNGLKPCVIPMHKNVILKPITLNTNLKIKGQKTCKGV